MERKSLSIILVFVFLLNFIFTSCSKDDPDPTLSVSVSELNVESTGGNESFTISSNVKWTISGHENWVQVTPASGEGEAGITVNVSENMTALSRSCTMHVKSTDGTLQKDISIKQSGAEVNLSTDVSSVSLESQSGSSQAVNVKANMSWTISNVADWLNVSALSGNGNSSIALSSKSYNESASVRKDTLIITSEGKNIALIVSQAAGLSSCAVRPANIVTLSDQLAYNLNYTDNVQYYLSLLSSKEDLERLSDSDILSKLSEETHDTPSDMYVTSYKNMKSGTNYILCTVAFDKNGNRGEIIKTPIITKDYLNIDAVAYISDPSYNSNYFYWTTSKGGYCDTYHMIAGTNVPLEAATCYGVTYAWIINYYISTKKYGLTQYNYGINLDLLNGDTYQRSYTSSSPVYVFVATWGKFKDGTMSPTCQYIQGKIASSSSSKIKNLTKSSISGIQKITTPVSAFNGLKFIK